MAADKETQKIESARKSGKALTGSDFRNKLGFQSGSMKNALSGLLKGDQSKNMSADQLAEQESKRRGYKRGGPVKKTGKALLHKGEHVLTKNQTKRMRGK